MLGKKPEPPDRDAQRTRQYVDWFLVHVFGAFHVADGTGAAIIETGIGSYRLRNTYWRHTNRAS